MNFAIIEQDNDQETKKQNSACSYREHFDKNLEQTTNKFTHLFVNLLSRAITIAISKDKYDGKIMANWKLNRYFYSSRPTF